MVVMGQSRNIKLSDLMCYPLGPLPWALATPDGSLRKTNKAALAANLKKGISLKDTVTGHSAIIIDGMALVQRAKFDGQQPTFHDIADRILSMAISEASNCTRLDIVFDTYKPLSIKYNERANRATPGLQVHSLTSGQKIKQWRKFLAIDSNKMSLIHFLVKEWHKQEFLQKLENKHKLLLATCEENCFLFSPVRCREVPELNCVQEEADGRLLLHAGHAA